MTRSILVGLIGATVLAASSACANSTTPEQVEASLKAVSASAIEGASPAGIEVIDQSKSAAKWTWKVKTGGKVYACDADNEMRLPSCVPAA